MSVDFKPVFSAVFLHVVYVEVVLIWLLSASSESASLVRMYSVQWLVGASWPLVTLSVVNQSLFEERLTSKQNTTTKDWDKSLVFYLMLLPLLAMLAATLEHRYSGPPGNEVSPLCWMLYALQYNIFGFAMLSNNYFSMYVRIQTDRQHRVVDSGLYRWVRHPGYFALLALPLWTPWLLQSVSSIVFALGYLVVNVVRTKWEDDTLKAELPGYTEYTRRVRWMLIPGIM
eukprot:GFYU01034263.1.p1 GENE.GFYU01034263.1~~GFYU01034263.1.p1  ORF type:complete len:245 (-),score=57.96 GFYU01034263.1:95-781(-)